MSLLTTAIHAATGVPRLFAAALRAGASPAEAARVVAISGAATSMATRHGRGVPGRQNALRHFAWQALLTARHGRRLAEAVAVAQESGTPNAADSRVDRHNNGVGQDYGATHAADLVQGSVGDVMERLAEVALAKWESGELIRVRPR